MRLWDGSQGNIASIFEIMYWKILVITILSTTIFASLRQDRQERKIDIVARLPSFGGVSLYKIGLPYLI